MAEKVIRNNQSLVPFFGERLSFIRGLDPLGLQNTSDSTFSMLLPGLNNVTGRLRYYSFYSWLLDEYSKQNGSTNPDDQKKFIRRAEYILALVSQYYVENASSIPGSNYAFREVKINKQTTHDLQASTYKPNGATAETYWNYPFGAFGQYYLGSMRDIGIVSDRDTQTSIYVRTNSSQLDIISGEMLAKAFDQNISEPVKLLFFDCINDGFITESQLLTMLTELDMTIIPDSSLEQELLLKMLIQKDFPLKIEEEPSTLRNQTLFHLLDFLKVEPEKVNDREFVYYAYNEKGVKNEELDPSLFGWYFYQFNEFWHVSNTSIFNGTLAHLENIAGPNWMPLRQLVESLAEGVIEELKNSKFNIEADTTVREFIGGSDLKEYTYLDMTFRSAGIQKISNAFLLMFSLYQKNLSELLKLKEYSENNNLGKDGEGSTYFILQFPAKLENTLHSFIYEYLFKNIIYRHQYVAFRKIGGGNQSTQKFIIEDHHIRYLGNFEAGYTGPRLGTLLSFMKDLGVITKDSKLTENGDKLLINLQKQKK
jgi:hypothetical protein